MPNLRGASPVGRDEGDRLYAVRTISGRSRVGRRRGNDEFFGAADGGHGAQPEAGEGVRPKAGASTSRGRRKGVAWGGGGCKGAALGGGGAQGCCFGVGGGGARVLVGEGAMAQPSAGGRVGPGASARAQPGAGIGRGLVRAQGCCPVRA